MSFLPFYNHSGYGYIAYKESWEAITHMNNKEFFETVPLGLCVVQRDGGTFKILYANHAFLYLLRNPAYVTPFDVLEKPLAEIWPGKTMAELLRKLKTPAPPRDVTIP